MFSRYVVVGVKEKKPNLTRWPCMSRVLRNPAMINQLRLVVCPIFCRCFLHPSWCRILAINSNKRSIPYDQVTHWLFSSQRKNDISCTICSSLVSYTLTTTCLLSDMPPSWLDMTSFCPGKWRKMWLNNLRIHYTFEMD